MNEQRVVIESDLDIVAARVEGRELAKAVGFGVIDQARIATAISELARNVVLYAGEGVVKLRRLEEGGRVGIEVVCEDKGPGIEDVRAAMADGYSGDGRGLGMGLPGTRRLMDEFELETAVGQGTKVTARKWLH